MPLLNKQSRRNHNEGTGKPEALRGNLEESIDKLFLRIMMNNLLTVVRYIHQNLIKAGLVKGTLEYR